MNHSILTYLIAAVWLINGLICKVLDLVPRHREIVTRILGDTYARELTVIIGFLEILMAIWVLTGIKSRVCAVTQIVIVLTMNVIEFFLAPDLLLFGRMNFVVALVFVTVVYFNEFILNRKPA